jgi:hypothetical protein
MSGDENDEGLTRPLIDNIGGVIDQDAPSADRFEEDRAVGAPWDNDEPIVREDERYEQVNRDDDAVIPDPYGRGMDGLAE